MVFVATDNVGQIMVPYTNIYGSVLSCSIYLDEPKKPGHFQWDPFSHETATRESEKIRPCTGVAPGSQNLGGTSLPWR